MPDIIVIFPVGSVSSLASSIPDNDAQRLDH